jgi:MinD superfamily P-loop ATPase
MLVDGPPGIGCPVISAMSGVDASVIVTEPSLAGIHDLERALGAADHFHIPSYVCVNKADIYPRGTELIKQLCQQKGIIYLGEIPYDLHVPRAMAQGLPVTRFAPQAPASLAVGRIWQALMELENPGTIKASNNIILINKQD